MWYICSDNEFSKVYNNSIILYFSQLSFCHIIIILQMCPNVFFSLTMFDLNSLDHIFPCSVCLLVAFFPSPNQQPLQAFQ